LSRKNRQAVCSSKGSEVFSPLDFAIPPKEGNYEAALSVNTFNADAELRWMSPHMHCAERTCNISLAFPDNMTWEEMDTPFLAITVGGRRNDSERSGGRRLR